MPRMRSNLALQTRGQLIRCARILMVEAPGTDWMDNDLRLVIRASLDEVSPLSRIEMLLWNAEPCPSPPTRDYPGAIENAAYRLVALGVLDSSSAKIAMEGTP